MSLDVAKIKTMVLIVTDPGRPAEAAIKAIVEEAERYGRECASPLSDSSALLERARDIRAELERARA